MRWRCSIGLVLTIACSSETELKLSLPDLEGMEALLLIVQSDEGSELKVESVTALDLREPAVLRFSIEEPARHQIYLLGYESWETLSRFGIASGSVESVSPSEPNSAPIPEPEAKFRLSSFSMDTALWRADPELDPASLPFRLSPGPEACDRYPAEYRNFEPLFELGFRTLLPLDDNSFLGGGGDFVGEAFLGIASYTEPFVPIELPADLLDVYSLAQFDERTFIGTTFNEKIFIFDLETKTITATAATDGTVRVTGSGGAVVRSGGRRPIAWIDRNFQEWPIGEDAPDALYVALNGETEIYGGNSAGLHHFDGESWQQIYCCFPRVADVFSGYGSVGVLGNGVVTMRNADDPAGWIELNVPTSLELQNAVFIGPTSILIGGASGYTAVWTGEQWCELETNAARSVRDIALSPSGRYAFTVTYGDSFQPASSSRIPVE